MGEVVKRPVALWTRYDDGSINYIDETKGENDGG